MERKLVKIFYHADDGKCNPFDLGLKIDGGADGIVDVNVEHPKACFIEDDPGRRQRIARNVILANNKVTSGDNRNIEDVEVAGVYPDNVVSDRLVVRPSFLI